MKLLEGYVENRTKEAALAAILAALTVVGRSISIPIFIPPLHGLDVAIAFWSLAVIVLSYPYVFLIAFMMTLTSSLALIIFPGYVISLSILYFINRAIGFKRAKYFSFFASIINMIVWLTFWGPLVAPELSVIKILLVPMSIKSVAQGMVAVILVPILLKTLEVFSFVDLSGGA